MRTNSRISAWQCNGPCASHGVNFVYCEQRLWLTHVLHRAATCCSCPWESPYVWLPLTALTAFSCKKKQCAASAWAALGSHTSLHTCSPLCRHWPTNFWWSRYPKRGISSSLICFTTSHSSAPFHQTWLIRCKQHH